MSERDGAARWAAYYADNAARPPRPTLLAALERFEAERAGAEPLAVDLGCGGGRDTIELLRRGWRVVAIDAEAEAISALRARPDLPPEALARGRLVTQVAPFWAAEWPPALLANASFSLPQCPPAQFPAVWQRIWQRLLPGGRFAGQLYGPRDTWAAAPRPGREPIAHFTRAALDALLAGTVVEMLHEEEEDSVTPRGEAKHWHIFHIVARKPTPASGLG
ncbi:MAG: class I SAM-dependent methyltransferase [Alphaproteobacteria bacterium]|nr:class I SAM-dependent methyltransferase [Alphaproteobacteria bacterium]